LLSEAKASGQCSRALGAPYPARKAAKTRLISSKAAIAEKRNRMATRYPVGEDAARTFQPKACRRRRRRRGQHPSHGEIEDGEDTLTRDFGTGQHRGFCQRRGHGERSPQMQCLRARPHRARCARSGVQDVEIVENPRDHRGGSRGDCDCKHQNQRRRLGSAPHHVLAGTLWNQQHCDQKREQSPYAGKPCDLVAGVGTGPFGRFAAGDQHQQKQSQPIDVRRAPRRS
jgi:hypothetical protein